MDTIGKGPAILSTCVKRWRFFACKVGFLLQDRTKFGTAGLFRQTEHAKAVIRTVLYPGNRNVENRPKSFKYIQKKTQRNNNKKRDRHKKQQKAC